MATNQYHRHILPDLPGPLKMKQLLVWAVQRAAKEQTSRQAEWEELVAEPLTQGLHTNALGTSWYQRPATNGSVSYRANPVNTDMKECLGLYQRYHRQLSTELSQWKALETSAPAVPALTPPALTIEPALPSHDELVTVCKWLHRLPFHVDRLGWLLQVYGNFEGRSKQYCEDVFHQIFSRFFASAQKPTNPIHVLKALSSAPHSE